MARRARIVVPKAPHHIVQRGNRRQIVFFSPADKTLYMHLLKKTADEYKVDVICYCLMNNHIHLILVPPEETSLAVCLRKVHSSYSRMINERFDWRGHLWQDRFHSSPLDPAYLYNAVRYVLQNPVRAGLSKNAWDYEWSSAKYHVGERESDLLVENNNLLSELTNDPKDYLSLDLETMHTLALRKAAKANRPLGGKSFLKRMETDYGIPLSPPKKGRPPGSKLNAPVPN